MKDKVFPLYDIVAMDITSFCNLRCPFCLSDHTVPKQLMSDDVLEKAISLIPLVKGANFLFSCLYEPTLHPKFMRYLEKIPEQHRDKVFFSTNLSKQINKNTLDDLATSGIHHINISVDSLEKSTYEILRKGAKFSMFLDNLQRMVDIFSANKNAPKIFYISVVNKLNYKEIPKLIEQCAMYYNASFHDVREYWLLSHQNKLDWCLENKLSSKELNELNKSLTNLDFKFSFAEAGQSFRLHHPNNVYRGFDVENEKKQRANLYHLPAEAKGIRIHADGIVEIIGRNIQFSMEDISNPVSFFQYLADYMSLDIDKTKELREIAGELLRTNLIVKKDDSILYCIDDIRYDPLKIYFKGWCFNKSGKDVIINFLFPDKNKISVEYIPEKSPDVERIHGKLANQCRFSFVIGLNYDYNIKEIKKMSIEFSTIS